MKKLLKLSLRLTLVALLIAVAAYFIPTHYILRAPGHADDLSQIVHVQGGDPNHPGRLFMTTVIYEKANVLFCLYSLFDPHAQLVPSDESPRSGVAIRPVHGPVGTAEDMMESSKEVAKIVALRHLGYEIKVEKIGARVLGFLESVPAASLLKLNDVVQSVDGKPVQNVEQLRKAIQGLKAGDMITVGLKRDGKVESVKFPLVAHDGKAIIGIVIQDAVGEVKLPRNIDITTRNVNGASAGLMFTLEIIDQLTPGGITKGHLIAGTGTINIDGSVGAIEGTDLKEVAAERVGATVFLVPEANYPDVRDKLPGIKVVPVKTLDDALKAIKGL